MTWISNAVQRIPRHNCLLLAAFALLQLTLGATLGRAQDSCAQLGFSSLGVPTVLRSPGACPTPAGSIAGQMQLDNGDFSSALDGWTVEESGGSGTPGSVVADSGTALLQEGDSFLVSLRQSLVLPAGATSLSFRLIEAPGFDSTADAVPDAFEFSLLDEDSAPVLDSWDVLATSLFNVQEDGTRTLAPSVSAQGEVVTIDLSGVPAGTALTLWFDLIGADADSASALRIDDVELVVGDPSGIFLRGDLDGDGTRDEADAATLLALLFEGGPEGVDCSDLPDTDVADANDNEWRTIADYLTLRSHIEEELVLPDPADACGLDPSDELRGFDRVDPDYVVSGTDIDVQPPVGAENRDLTLTVAIQTPEALTGLTVILLFDRDSLTPFDALAGDPAFLTTGLDAESRVYIGEETVEISLWAADSGETLFEGRPGELQTLGELHFHLEDFALVRAFEWLAEDEGSGFLRRATFVDADGEDHQPQGAEGDVAFVRGNANNDFRVDISDAVFTLNFLFTGGDTPSCLDSADSNNSSRIDISDGIFSLNFLFIGGPTIPAPYPTCGLDAGPVDTLDCEEGNCEP